MKHTAIFLLMGLLLIILSCDDSDSEPNLVIPDELVGNWVSGDLEYHYYRLMISKRDAQNGDIMQHVIDKQEESGEFLIMIAIKGTFTVKDNFLSYIPTHVGSENPIWIGGPNEVSDTTIWYSPDHAYFQNLASQMKGDPEFEFQIEGDKLTIYSDNNLDGDFDDDDEISFYTREL